MKRDEIGTLCLKRLELIDRLDSGELDKENFILENYKMIAAYDRVGFNVLSVDEGIMKYHYFNTLAKKKMLEADALEYKDPRRSNQLKNEGFDYYIKKDRITLNMLALVDYQGVDAYYIHMNSKSLEGSIYEIDFLEFDRVILHSKDRKILHKLKTAGCFQGVYRDSRIKGYVNTKVY